jgi:hypothetical protein
MQQSSWLHWCTLAAWQLDACIFGHLSCLLIVIVVIIVVIVVVLATGVLIFMCIVFDLWHREAQNCSNTTQL